MKKMIVILCLLGVGQLSFGQREEIWQFASAAECVTFCDSLVKMGPRVYHRQGARAVPYVPDSFVVDYMTTDSMELHLVFRSRVVNANAALEIAGDSLYRLKFIRGKFLDLFPVWKEYINGNAVREAIASNGGETIHTEEPFGRFTFEEERFYKGYWKIDSTL